MLSFCKETVRRALAGLLSASLLISAFATNLPKVEAAEAEPILKVGILSDAQSMPGESRGIRNFRSALHQMKEKNMELLLDVGDISNEGDPKVWANYYKVFEEVYPDPESRPEYLAIMGNHDFYNTSNPQEHRETFNTIFHKESTNEHKVVKGYHFISITSVDSDLNYSQAELDWLDREIQKAIAEAPDQPVFVLGHPHAANTVYGSTTGWGKDILNTIFDKYPQVVYFSGHSHFPLDDERSIYQGNYTAIGTSSLNYLEMEPGKDQGIHPDGVYDNAQALYMEIYEDKVDIERMDIINECKVKEEDWVLNLPLSKDTFTYTSARADEREAPPAFDADDKVMVDEIGACSCVITFDQAKHCDFTHSYRIRVTNMDTGKEVRNFTIFSDFYNGVRNMKPTLSYSVSGLESNTTYRIAVSGIESFGKEGEPIVSKAFTTEDSLVFDADFTDGTPKDKGPYATAYEMHGNLADQDSGELGQKVLQFDGQSYVTLNMSDEQLQSLQKGFTLFEAKRSNKDASVILGMDLSDGAIKDQRIFNVKAKPFGPPDMVYEDANLQDVLRLDSNRYVDFFVSPTRLNDSKACLPWKPFFSWIPSARHRIFLPTAITAKSAWRLPPTGTHSTGLGPRTWGIMLPPIPWWMPAYTAITW